MAAADEHCPSDGLDGELWYLQHSLDFSFQHQQQHQPVEFFEPTSSHHHHLAASYLLPPPPPQQHPMEGPDGCGLPVPPQRHQPSIAADEAKPQPTQQLSPSESTTESSLIEDDSSPPSARAGRSAGRSRAAAAAGCEQPPPAKAKTPQMVAKRNARERRRVEAVNSAFAKLRRYIPYEKRNKRLSKVKTLRITIDYIRLLEVVLDEIKAGIDVECSPNYHNLKSQAHRKEVGALASANN